MNSTASQLETLKNYRALACQKKFQEDAQLTVENIYKADVLRVVSKGILSNVPKPKKVYRPPTPEPEINRLLHTEVRTIKELLDHFSEEEREVFGQELVHFSMSEEPTSYLLDRIDELAQHQDNPYLVHMSQVFKLLLKKRAEIAYSKDRLNRFDPATMEKHVEDFVKKVYRALVAEVRALMTAQKVEAL